MHIMVEREIEHLSLEREDAWVYSHSVYEVYNDEVNPKSKRVFSSKKSAKNYVSKMNKVKKKLTKQYK